jgi:hypothetical protein
VPTTNLNHLAKQQHWIRATCKLFGLVRAAYLASQNWMIHTPASTSSLASATSSMHFPKRALTVNVHSEQRTLNARPSGKRSAETTHSHAKKNRRQKTVSSARVLCHSHWSHLQHHPALPEAQIHRKLAPLLLTGKGKLAPLLSTGQRKQTPLL